MPQTFQQLRLDLAAALAGFLEPEEAHAEAGLWFEDGLGCSRSWMAVHQGGLVPPEVVTQVEVWLQRRRTGEPWAYILGWTLFRQGKIDTALPLLRQATVGMPGNPLHHYHLGVALLKNGQQDAGKKELAAALRISSTFDGAPQARDLMQQRKS